MAREGAGGRDTGPMVAEAEAEAEAKLAAPATLPVAGPKL